MSYRSGHHYSDHHHPHDHGRAPLRRPADYAAQAVAIDRDGYTIVHAGKQVRLGPVVFWIVVGTIVAARHVVGGDRHLFRVSRRRPDPADRPSGRDAIRL